MRTPAHDPRAIARRFVDDLRAADRDALGPAGHDVAPALEQVLFQALRAPATHARPPTRSRIARQAGALASAVGRGPTLDRSDALVVLLAGVHAKLFEPIGAELTRRSPTLRVGRVTAGRASRDRTLRRLPSSAAAPGWGDARRFAAVGIGAGALEAATRGWADAIGPEATEAMRGIAGDAITRLGIEAIRLDSAVRAARPRVVVTYDEVDAWGRLLTAVAGRHGVPVVDLPHAEAVDVDAIRGVDYTAMGVFGPRAAGVLEAAGVPSERIAVVGPARFDGLVHAASAPIHRPPRVLLAAQYRGRAMTDELRSTILAAAAAAADAIGGHVELLPHPTEEALSWEPAVAALHPRPASAIRIVSDAGLHDRLPGAALLVTGWSNSVYEAVLAGVPAITVQPGPGEPPMPFAREGISTEVRSVEEAAVAATRLVEDPGRSEALARARPSLTDHLGPLDGRATARTADLVARFLGG